MEFTRSILSPVRGGAAGFSFLRRRLRRNGSLKGGQGSSFFGKKRGGAFENHEPSSPKVTCIGQVRVKSKKKVKQCRRRIGGVSFRKTEQRNGGGGDGAVQRSEDRDKVWSRQQRLSSNSSVHHYQRWVHLPVSVCEALRAFRAEFCCFSPCRCFCFSICEREENTKKSGCYANVARWLVSVNGGEGERRREIEVVVGGGGDVERAEMMSFRSSRRHVFEDVEVRDEREDEEDEEEEEEEARVSICIPPKNALLLMRCRSDPMQMAALANRFSLDAAKYEDDADEIADFEEQDKVRGLFEKIFVAEVNQDFEVQASVELNQEQEQEIRNEAKADLEMEVGNHGEVEEVREEELIIRSEEKEQENKNELIEEMKEEVESNMHSFEAVSDKEKTEHLSESPQSGERNEATLPPEKEKQGKTEQSIVTQTQIKSEPVGEDEEVKIPALSTELDAEKSKTQEMVKNNQETSPVLPECLLLMMREPKLSMEISKETWLGATDFIKLLPQRPRKAAAKATATSGSDHEPIKKKPSIDYKPKPRVPVPPNKKNDHQPARSSCSFPVASTATVIEQKQVKMGKCELTRCKSEPMSTAAAKLMPLPESCCWKNNAGMKLEPHRQAALGVGAAGVGC